MNQTATKYLRETNHFEPLTTDQVFADLTDDEIQVVFRLVQVLRERNLQMRKAAKANKGDQDPTLSLLTEIVETFLPQFLEGDPNLPVDIEKWFSKRRAGTTHWRRIAARRQRRSQMLKST